MRRKRQIFQRLFVLETSQAPLRTARQAPEVFWSYAFSLRATHVSLWAAKFEKFEKWPFLDPKIEFLVNKTIFPGKMVVGICSYIIELGPHAKFQGNR